MTWPLRQSTASQEIPLGPFVDSTDGNTAETGLTIANTDIKIQKAGGTTQTNKNSGGATHIATGDYYAVLDATDTDTVGPTRVKVHVAGALPVWLDCHVYEEAVYDDLFAASAGGYLKPTTAGRTLDVASTGEAGVDFDNILFSGNGPFAPLGIIDRGTAQAADANGITLRAGFSTAAANMVGVTAWVYSSTNGLHARGLSTAYNNTTKVLTLSGLGEAPTGTVLYALFASPPGSALSVNLEDNAISAAKIATGAITNAKFAAGAIDAAAIAANAIDASALAADAVTEIQGGLATAAALTTVAGYLDTEIAAILADTDAMTTTGVTLANGAHGGSSTTIVAKSIAVTNSDAGGIAVDLVGSGTGNSHALRLQSTNGHGLAAGSTNGNAINAASTSADAVSIAGGTNSDGLQIAGNGTGVDVRANVTGNITGNVSGSVGSVTGLTAANVGAILALLDDARTEPGQGAPPVNPDLATKIDYLYKAWRNRKTQTATEFALYADDGTTKDQESAVSSDGTTLVIGEMATGA